MPTHFTFRGHAKALTLTCVYVFIYVVFIIYLLGVVLGIVLDLKILPVQLLHT